MANELTPPTIDLSVITVNWNVRDLLLHAMATTAASAGPLTFEHIVIDNAAGELVFDPLTEFTGVDETNQHGNWVAGIGAARGIRGREDARPCSRPAYSPSWRRVFQGRQRRKEIRRFRSAI